MTVATPAYDYTKLWDKMFASRSWGRYPPEDLVRFMGRRFKTQKKEAIKVLEVGCGPGANLWFLHREGYHTHGIDSSETGISHAKKRLDEENVLCRTTEHDLQVGNFSHLPWQDASMDVVIDIFALYANTPDVIIRALKEIQRVLKPGGVFYSKSWGKGCTGFGEGVKIDKATYDQIPRGPFKDMGVTHFFDETSLRTMFGTFFEIEAIDRVWRTDAMANQEIEEFHCQFKKAC